MTYLKQTWADGEAGGTPIDAASLNYMEDGIGDAHTLVAAVQAEVDALPAPGDALAPADVLGSGDITATVDSVAGTVTLSLTSLLSAIAYSGAYADLTGKPNTPVIVRHTGGSDPLRPATTLPVIWDVPDTNRPLTNGTTAGGAYAAVDNLDYLWTH